MDAECIDKWPALVLDPGGMDSMGVGKKFQPEHWNEPTHEFHIHLTPVPHLAASSEISYSICILKQL
jgi:hypothetical protein